MGFLGDDVEVEETVTPEDFEVHAGADAFLGQEAVEVVESGDRAALEADDDVAFFQPASLGRPSGLDLDDQDAGI